jgi:uncharacterized protein (DUF2249 family)
MNSKKKIQPNDADSLIITPETKIGKLLDSYPHLEKLLVNLSPEFKKLNNPVLRRTIAKIASLKQAAEIGEIPLEEFMNKLREAVGQTRWTNQNEIVVEKQTKRPEWFRKEDIVFSIDARPLLDRGEHPVDLVLNEAKKLKDNDILELISPFLPKPLIDMLMKRGYKIWTEQISSHLYKTYIQF